MDGRLDHRARGRRLALRFAGLQVGCAGVVALIAFATSGAAAGSAALAGGLVVAVGNVLFGWTLFAPGVAPILADGATYAGVVVLGHAVMRLIAGPAGDDRLVRHPAQRMGAGAPR